MPFGDFISSLFGGGGDSGGIPEGQTAQGGSFAPKDPSGGGGGADPLMAAILGVGAPLLSKLIAGNAGDKASKNLSKIANLGTSTGSDMMKAAAAGKLTPSQQATVDLMKKEQNARWGQYLAGLGIPVSSAMVQGQNEVDLKAQKLANDLINQSFQQGMDALKLGGANSQAVLAQAMADKKDLSNTIGELAKQLGLLWGTNQPNQPGQMPMMGGAQVPEQWGTIDPNYETVVSDPFA